MNRLASLRQLFWGTAGLRQLFWGALLSIRAFFWLLSDLSDHRDLFGVGIHVLAGLIGIGFLVYGTVLRLRLQGSEVGSPPGGQVAAHD